MNRFILAARVSLAPALALATGWKDVPLVDGDCKIGAHPRPEVDAAARRCERSTSRPEAVLSMRSTA